MLSEKRPKAQVMREQVVNTVNTARKLCAAISLLTTEAPKIELTILGKIDLPPARIKRSKIPEIILQPIGERKSNTINKVRKLRAAIKLLTTEAPKIELTILGKIDLPPARIKKPREKMRTDLQIPDTRQLSHGSRHILRSFIAQQGKCYYCQSLMKLHRRREWNTRAEYATVEHLYPRGDLRRYLLNDRQCTVIACHHCNAEKNDQTLHSRYHYDEMLRMPALVNMIVQYTTGKAV